jgi:hypothetical protein
VFRHVAPPRRRFCVGADQKKRERARPAPAAG